jgi:glycosyltransferase involved in cell wall biosynthesis
MNKKTKIVLNAMVANEARTITRMLDSVYPYIDYWVIQDNGSTDGTQDIITNYFKEKGIPGFLYEIEWQFPGWNRDHALQTCLKTDHGCDWILRMDADERLEVDEDFDWSLLEDESIDSWNIIVRSFNTRYYRTWLWNARRPWFFQHDKRHETIHLPEVGENFTRMVLPESFRHIVTNDGQTWFAPRKFLRDALELEIDKVVGNTVLDDTYHLWYVGKSYSDCYGNPDELAFGKDHSDEYARRAIYYFRHFMRVTHNYWETGKPARLDEMAYTTFMLMASAHAFRGEDKEAEDCWNQAEQFAPGRNEHHLYHSFFLEEKGRFEEALSVVNKMMSPERKNPFPNYCFLIENRAYMDTGSEELNEFKSRLTRRISEPTIKNEGVTFSFK